ncbi:MAG: ATP-dependent DNA helicase RecG [Bacillus sp. (in: Bacteria)]|nr:ATP-dependent DNA helicase RecG [Bacillus sp. (in: firmicutes)]MCM1427693.1 ATP-dependent DNA helicase RecG [Eubacterium sp.]
MEITALKGIGDKTAKLFAKLGITQAEELLHYYPRDYEQFEPPVTIAKASAGERVAIRGVITGNMALRHVRNLSILSFTVQDASGVMQMTYFNMPYLKNSLKKGTFYIFRGLVQQKGNKLVMEQAKTYKPEEYESMTNHLLPKYMLTKGLSNHALTKAVTQAFSVCMPQEEFLPEPVMRKYRFMPRKDAVYQMHFPADRETLLQARKRLVFDEFFLFIMMLRRMKSDGGAQPNHYRMIEVAETKRLIEALPYRLTNAQQKVWGEIQADLCSETVMNRLIQGDVGSGKTILAFLSLMMCAANGAQGAMMAPTEVLAKQHFDALMQLKEKYALVIHPVLLTGSTTAKDRKVIYAQIENGEADIIIGTHALIQDKVQYHKLALVITDEQHRFGVRQRETLAGKGSFVHVLVMSATPIPRTLAIILYGDLHISVLDELPADRLAVKNCVVGPSYRETAYRFIEKEVNAGRQAYVICPMVEEGQMDELEDVVSYTAKLKAVLPPSIQVASLHGKMKPAEKNRIMEQFEAHHIDVLVSTTVIEVGINVPNATVMMIENAERFGLAGLHQLRGRVGRGAHQSYCIFISTSDNKETMERLQILNESNDGFYIASQDLKMRGPGDLFGIRQSGIMTFALGDIYTDASVLQQASEEADAVYADDPRLESEVHSRLRAVLEQSVQDAVDFRTI